MVRANQIVTWILNALVFLFVGSLFIILFIFTFGWVVNVAMGDMKTSHYNQSFLNKSKKYYYKLPRSVTSPVDGFFDKLTSPLNRKTSDY